MQKFTQYSSLINGKYQWSLRHLAKSRHLWYQVRIQDLVKGGPVSEGGSCRRSEAESCEQSEQFAAGSRARLRALEAFGFLMLNLMLFFSNF